MCSHPCVNGCACTCAHVCVSVGFTPTCAAMAGTAGVRRAVRAETDVRVWNWSWRGGGTRTHLGLPTAPSRVERCQALPGRGLGRAVALLIHTEQMRRRSLAWAGLNQAGPGWAWPLGGRRRNPDFGGEPTAALILSTVAKGLVVCGIILVRGRSR